MNTSAISIFDSLETVDWRIAAKTYGNNHSTLIGLIVHWWISQSPENRQVLEGAPPHGYEEAGVKLLGQGDALLCQDRKPLGIVEVEGTRWEHTARKIGYYFNSQVQEYENINFGLLLMYVTGAKGRGEEKAYPSASHPGAIHLVKEITVAHPEKAVIIITLDKKVLPLEERIINNHYYSGKPHKIAGHLYIGGEVEKQCEYYNAEQQA